MEYIEIIKSAVTQNWGGLLVVLLPFAVPNKYLRALCFRAGRIVSLFLGRKLGPSGEQVETYFQGTIAAMVGGFNDGLDADDKKK